MTERHFVCGHPLRLRALAWPLLVFACGAAAAVPTTPAAPTPAERAQLERQLDDARARLDDAARDVADLTQKLHGDAMDDVLEFHRAGGARGAMLGVNIGGEQARADGVEVMGVSPSGPAETAGLRRGDVIVAVDGQALKKDGDRTPARQLVEHLHEVEPGKVVKLDYLRDGKRATAAVTTVAAEPPMVRMLRERLPPGAALPLPPEFEEIMGHGRGFRPLELVAITPKLGQYFGTDKGLLVVKAPASGSKLEEGDVVLTIGGRTPENPRHAFRILGSYSPSETVKVEVLRQRKRMTVDLQVPEDAGERTLLPAPPLPATPARPVQPGTAVSS